MEYYFSKILPVSFEEAEARVREALKTEGFGVVTELDMKEKLKEKLNADIKKYKILGACHPPSALKALQAEEKIGTMLPCNVVLVDRENGTTEVAAVDPVASMMAIQNDSLEPVARDVAGKLKKIIESLK